VSPATAASQEEPEVLKSPVCAYNEWDLLEVNCIIMQNYAQETYMQIHKFEATCDMYAL